MAVREDRPSHRLSFRSPGFGSDSGGDETSEPNVAARRKCEARRVILSAERGASEQGEKQRGTRAKGKKKLGGKWGRLTENEKRRSPNGCEGGEAASLRDQLPE